MVLRLHRYNESPYPRLFYFNPYLNRIVHQHLTCAEFACLPEAKLGYLVASFVRNPYDRVYSGFRQLQKDVQEQPRLKFRVAWMRRHVLIQLSEILVQLKKANFDFDLWLESVTEAQIYDIGRNTNFNLHPAFYWTHIGKKQLVDFVGKVETFEEDFERFLKMVGIEEVSRANANVVDLEGSSSSNPFGYRYVDRMKPASIQKINRLFSRDFELFGYERIS